MSGFTQSFINDLKLKITLSDFVKNAVTWDKKKSVPARQDWWGPCPFHYEKSASFHVDDRKGFYHCFGCGVHGSIIDWLIEFQKMTFIEAMKHLCQVTNTALPEFSQKNIEVAKSRKSLFDLMQQAQAYYVHLLLQPQNHDALDYIHRKRGLSKEHIEYYGIGYADSQRDGVFRYLSQQGFTPNEITASGLIIVPDNNGSPYDRFRDRIMFPVKNQQGHIITYGGRSLSKDVKAKYLNGSETDIFKKSSVLYNIDKITHQRISEPELIICEGYMDVISMGVYGFKNCVAPMGTALTEAQIKILWRYHSEPIICFDGDKAGLEAACRVAHKVLSILTAGYSLRFCFLPSGLDPDDYLKKFGKEALKEALTHAVSLSAVLFSQAVEKQMPTTPERRAGLEKSFFEITNQIQDERLRKLYQSDFFKKLNQYVQPNQKSQKSFYRSDNSFYQKQYVSESVGVKNYKTYYLNNQSDSDNDYELKVLGLFIRFSQYLKIADFDLLSQINFENAEKKAIQGAILNNFLKNRNKMLENSQNIDSIPTGQFDLETENLWQLTPDICQSDTYRQSLLVTKSIDAVKMFSSLPFINPIERINYYSDIIHHELITIYKKMLSDKRRKKLYNRLLVSDDVTDSKEKEAQFLKLKQIK